MSRVPEHVVGQLALLEQVVPGAVEVIAAQVEERLRQVREHGGPDKDVLKHGGLSWIELIVEFLDKAMSEGRLLAEAASRGLPIDGRSYRQRLVQVAALAEAAVEAYDYAEREH